MCEELISEMSVMMIMTRWWRWWSIRIIEEIVPS